MIVPQTSRIVDFMGDFHEKWCVYEIWTYNEAETRDECIFIGVCRLVHLFNFPDARRNTEWPKRVTQRTVITVIIRASGTAPECYNERGRLFSTMQPRPICNAQGFDTHGTTTRVICNETGQTFETQTDACATLGINPGRLSQHLNGRPGARTVNGYTFRRV
jgi:hypothetical protein